MYRGRNEFTMLRRGAIHFGVGESEKTGLYAREDGMTKALVVTDPGVKRSGAVDQVCESLEKEGIDYAVFDEIAVDAPVDIIEECSRFARENHVDGVIGVGGGSVLDSSKCTDIFLSYPQKTLEDLLEHPPKTHSLPLFLLSTTSGTGADISNSCIIHDPKTDRKLVLAAEAGCADRSIIDPALTIGCPSKVTLYCGLDVLSHAIGMYTNWRIPEYADCQLETVFKRVSDFLGRAVKNGEDMEARIQMSFACMTAGMLMKDVKCHLDHMLGQEAAPVCHLPHGLLVGLALPVTLKYTAKVFPDRVKTINTALGFSYSDSMTGEELGEKAAADMRLLLEHFGVGPFSSYYKMTEQDIAQLRKNCKICACWGNQPFSYTDEDLDAIIKEYIR